MNGTPDEASVRSADKSVVEFKQFLALNESEASVVVSNDVMGWCLPVGQVTSLSHAAPLGTGRSVQDLLGAYRLTSKPPKGSVNLCDADSKNVEAAS